MRQVTRKGLMTVAAATGVIAAVGGSAQADSGASGSSSNSPGVLSGNTVQAPVHAPVNVCGNTVNVVGVLNSALGNTCVDHGGGSHADYGDSGGSGGAHSGGHASDSPGVASGNQVEVPVHAPVNVCGNSVNVVGIGNYATGNDCANGGGSGGGGEQQPPGSGQENPPDVPEQPGNPGGPENPGNSVNNPGNPVDLDNPDGSVRSGTPGKPGAVTPDGTPQADLLGARSVTQPGGVASLAATGSDLPLGFALPMGAGALLAGAVLYRKARASA